MSGMSTLGKVAKSGQAEQKKVTDMTQVYKLVLAPSMYG